MLKINDTIAAVSTPRGKGGVALLRISGPDAFSIAEKVFTPKSGKKLTEYPFRTEIYGTIYTYENQNKIAVDDGMIALFSSPNSFTGEDTAEICCHGGSLLTETILQTLFQVGCRPAEAGEFTRRAFVNGKMGLSSCESLGELLEAKTKGQIFLAHNGLDGKREKAVQEIYDAVSSVLSSVYVKIDYPDEDLADLSREEMIQRLLQVKAKLKTLSESYRVGHAVAEGIPTVICGSPNVGKSTLYNALVGRDVAIVTSIAGTTRDVLSETVSFGGVTLRLFDTAGIHDTEDVVEKIGVERAKNAIDSAELVLYLLDATRMPTEDELTQMTALEEKGKHVIYLLTKSDLPSVYHKDGAISVSAQNGEGLSELKEKLISLFLSDTFDIHSDPILTNARQASAVQNALQSLSLALSTLQNGYPIDLSCSDLEHAMQSLSETDGRAVSEDIVSAIFSHFCVGK